MALISSGYGAPAKNIMFTGEEEDYEIWETKFLSYLRLQKIHKYVLNADDSIRTSPYGIPAATATNGAEVQAAVELDAEKNADVFASLIQFLDNKSVHLIIRDAKNDGRAALNILRDHYKGSSKPLIIAMYSELTSLKLSAHETVTEYLLRAETCKARLTDAG